MSSPINFKEQELIHIVGTGIMVSPINFRDVVSIWVSFINSPVNHRVDYEFLPQSTSMSMHPHEV